MMTLFAEELDTSGFIVTEVKEWIQQELKSMLTS